MVDVNNLLSMLRYTRTAISTLSLERIVAADCARQRLRVRGCLAPVPVAGDVGAWLKAVGSSPVKVVVSEHFGYDGSAVILPQRGVLVRKHGVVELCGVDHGVVPVRLARVRK